MTKKLLLLIIMFAVTRCENNEESSFSSTVEKETSEITLPNNTENKPIEVDDFEFDSTDFEIMNFNKEVYENLHPKNDSVDIQIVSEEFPECNHKQNWVENGSFEITDNRKGLLHKKKLERLKNKGWDAFRSLPSTHEGISSWNLTSGAGIEVQGYRTAARTPAGKMSVELDAHGKNSNSSMSQLLFLCKGTYTFSFLYYPRTTNKDDNIILVSLDEKLFAEANLIHNRQWHIVRHQFKVNKSKYYEINFAAAGTENTIGGIIDDIQIHRSND